MSYIQSASAATAGSGTCSVLLSGTVAGRLLVLSVSISSQADVVLSCAGDLSGALTRADWFGISSHGVHIYYKENCTGGDETVTLTTSGFPVIALALHEFSGMLTSGALDQADLINSGGTTSTDGNASPSVVTTTDGQLIFGVAHETSGTGTTYTPGTGFTGAENGVDANSFHNRTEYLTQSVAGSIQATFTASTTDNSIIGVATFKVVGGNGGGVRMSIGS
jgi:hypothetical protein